jgi:uncharacterized protein YndB with AHSA1/START domain
MLKLSVPLLALCLAAAAPCLGQSDLTGPAGDLTVTLPSATEVTITRTLSAPPDRVFSAWTEAEHIARWMTGPPGWRVAAIESDARVGGTYKFSWIGPAGEELSIGGTYREIERPGRLVSTDAWEGWPETTNTLLLEEDEVGTALSLTIRYASEEVRHQALATGMTDGMAGTLANLDKFVSELP